MALNVDVQIITQPGATGVQQYNLASNFDPKAVIVYGVPATADINNLASWAFSVGFGTYRSSTVSQRYVSMRGLDASTTADNAKGSGSTAICVLLTQGAGLATRDLEVGLDSMQTGATSWVKLNWVNLHTTASIKLVMVALGGSDITDAYVTGFQLGTAATTQDVPIATGFGQPDLLFAIANGTNSDSAVGPNFAFGFAKKGEPGRGYSFTQLDGNTASLTSMYQRQDRLLLGSTSTSATASTDRFRGRLDDPANWPTDNVRFLFDANPAVADWVWLLAIKGSFLAATFSNTAVTSGTPTVNQDNWTGVGNGAFVAVGTTAIGGSGSSSLAPGIPAGMQAGDRMYCVVTSSDNGTHTATGWTSAGASNSGTTLRMTVLERAWQAGDTAPSIARSAGSETWSARIVGVRGVSGVDQIAFQAGSASTTATAPSVTTANDGDFLLALFAEELSSNTSGSPAWGTYSDSLLAEVSDFSAETGLHSVVQAITWEALGAAGATGNKTAVVSGEAATPTVTLGCQVALTPSAPTAGFSPVFALVAGWNLAPSTAVQNSAADQAQVGIGVYDGTDQAWAGFTEDDAAGTMISKSQFNTAHVLMNLTPTTPTLTSSAVASFSGQNFRMGWDDTDTVGREYFGLILGSGGPTSTTLSGAGTAQRATGSGTGIQHQGTVSGGATAQRATGSGTGIQHRNALSGSAATQRAAGSGTGIAHRNTLSGAATAQRATASGAGVLHRWALSGAATTAATGSGTGVTHRNTLNGSATAARATGSGAGIVQLGPRTLSGAATAQWATGSGTGITHRFSLSGAASAQAPTGGGAGIAHRNTLSGGAQAQATMPSGTGIQHRNTLSGASTAQRATGSGAGVLHRWALSGAATAQRATGGGAGVLHRFTLSGAAATSAAGSGAGLLHRWSLSGSAATQRAAGSGTGVLHRNTLSGSATAQRATGSGLGVAQLVTRTLSGAATAQRATGAGVGIQQVATRTLSGAGTAQRATGSGAGTLHRWALSGAATAQRATGSGPGVLHRAILSGAATTAATSSGAGVAHRNALSGTSATIATSGGLGIAHRNMVSGFATAARASGTGGGLSHQSQLGGFGLTAPATASGQLRHEWIVSGFGAALRAVGAGAGIGVWRSLGGGAHASPARGLGLGVSAPIAYTVSLESGLVTPLLVDAWATRLYDLDATLTTPLRVDAAATAESRIEGGLAAPVRVDGGVTR